MGNEVCDWKVNFQGREYGLSFHRYEGAPHLALGLIEPGSDTLVHWASVVCAPEAGLKPNQVLVNDRCEASGMLRALEAAGIVRATGRQGRWCGISLPVAELLVEPPAHLKLPLGPRRPRDRDRGLER